MQTKLADEFKDTHEGRTADRILRSCVHCGFCTATCPTYQLLGDELDGPRGRIYLIKQVLEGASVTAKTQLHLDRCLTCRACETTCPSGVEYGRLVDIGRAVVERKVRRPWTVRVTHWLLRQSIPYPLRYGPVLRVGQWLRPWLPAALRRKIPVRQNVQPWPTRRLQRRMLVLEGCAQSVTTPATNGAAARVLDRLGISLIAAPGAGCCGALSHHLSAAEEARQYMRRNIDAWWPLIESGAEAIVITASGCGAVVKEYGELLAGDTEYAEKAARISALCRDISEVLMVEGVPKFGKPKSAVKVAFHAPCTLQHGQKIVGVVESLLQSMGFELTSVADAHLCCGSAGTYSILQPELAQKLLRNKLCALEEAGPDVIATGNVGCQIHLATRSSVPVKHWIELLDERLE